MPNVSDVCFVVGVRVAVDVWFMLLIFKVSYWCMSYYWYIRFVDDVYVIVVYVFFSVDVMNAWVMKLMCKLCFCFKS